MNTTSKNSNIILIGFMGSGKTTVAEKLSVLLQMPFLDADREIEKKFQRTISQIFIVEEKTFRDAETNFLKKNLSKKKIILSLGGGIIEKKENRTLIDKIGLVVFLSCSFETIWKRIKDCPHRPMLQNTRGGKIALEKLYQKRLPYYKKADIIIANKKTSQRTAQEIAIFYKQTYGNDQNRKTK